MLEDQTNLAASPPESAALAAQRAWVLAAWVAGVFSVLLGLGMLLGHFQTKTDDPLNSPRLKEYRNQLEQSPADEPLKQQIRQLDLELRGRYFHQLSRMNSGVYLLLGGIAVFIFAATRAARFTTQPPMPQLRPEAPAQTARAAARARWSVAAAGAAIGAFLFLISLLSTTSLETPAATPRPPGPAALASSGPSAGGTSATPASVSDAASLDELRRNWPCFRGADGGVSFSTNAPIAWDVKTGAGVAWKIPALADGFNSPIVWDGRVFFSGGDAAKREVFCLDARSGKLLWRQAVANVPGSPARPSEVPDTTGYAAPTMATDGRRVYVAFAHGDVAGLSLDGKLLWSKYFGPLKNPYGHAASLATWQDRLILQLDQGESEEGKSKLCALDGRTGQVLWQRPRKVGSSWATPIVIQAAGKSQIITLAVPSVVAYDATDGAELWRVEGLDGEVTPSAAFAGGLVVVASPSSKLLAIRPDGHGDVTKSHVAWSNEDNVPDITSPVGNGELLFCVTTAGVLTCLDAKTGKQLWMHDYESECHASPVLAANHLYIFSIKGVAAVVEAARQYKELFHAEMPDAFHASPAFAQDKMFLRGVTNVYCIDAALKR